VVFPACRGPETKAKQLLQRRGAGQYFNWDNVSFRRLWTKDPSLIFRERDSKPTALVILDEIHKAKSWKKNLKGVFDSLERPLDILVTGSARLNIYKKGSDSLMGRYFNFRLHPFSIGELLPMSPLVTPQDLLSTLFSKPCFGSKKSQDIFKDY